MPWQELIGERLHCAADARSALRRQLLHYVYVLCRADGTPFYVGKGVGLRCFNHEAEARNSDRLTHKLNVLRSMARKGEPLHYCIESSFASEPEAHARERYLINLFGRHDQGRGPLTNQTDGGEGASNPSEESRERRRQNLWGEEAEDDERRIANRFFQRLCSVESVPVKPLSRFKPERLYANRAKFAMSSRQAAALAASAIANRVMLEPGAVLPRLLALESVAMAVENGVGRDMLSSNMVMLADTTVGCESFLLTPAGFHYLVNAIGSGVLVAAGVLDP